MNTMEPDQPDEWEVGRRLRRLRLAVVALLLATGIGGGAVTTVRDFALYFSAQGPNTVGEAGKVYFAKQVQQGRWPLAGGDAQPYYPSVHGILLHAMVGETGRWTGASVAGLYLIGRTFSVAFTLIGLAAAACVMRSLKVGAWGMGFALLIWLAPRVVVQHTVSYRPDNWVFAASMVACLLTMRHRQSWLSLAAMMLLPAAAFHFKASGAAILIAQTAALLAIRQRRAAAIVGIGGAASLGVSLIAINLACGGLYFHAMRQGLSNPASIGTLLQSISFPPLWLPLIAPVFLLGTLKSKETETTHRLAVVAAFWLVHLLASAVMACRLGSNGYYFLEAFTYGIVIAVAALSRHVRERRQNWLNPALACLLALYGLQAVPGTLRMAVDHPIDSALYDTKRFAAGRAALAERVNRQRLACFSDDPGLNVMLDEPCIIDPMVLSHLIQGGALPMDDFVDPVRKQAYDLIVLTQRQWNYRDLSHLPRSFAEAVNENYVPVSSGTAYLVLVPRRPGN
ncbi:MAG: hypothetical protein IT440_11005 [Phycisphaeraceae bacterium]|nr:hypothetical protein [Phycisphaeraceae bacterium]